MGLSQRKGGGGVAEGCLCSYLCVLCCVRAYLLQPMHSSGLGQERLVKSVRQINSWPKVHENAILFSKNTERRTHTHTYIYIQCTVHIPPQLQLQLHQRQQLQSAARVGLTSALEEDVVQSAVK